MKTLIPDLQWVCTVVMTMLQITAIFIDVMSFEMRYIRTQFVDIKIDEFYDKLKLYGM